MSIITLDVSQPTTLRQVLAVMTPMQLCEFLVDHSYINTTLYPSLTTADNLKAFVETHLALFSSKYWTWEKLTCESLITLLTILRFEPPATILYRGNSSAVTSTTMTIPGADGSFTNKYLIVIDGPSRRSIKRIVNWDNGTKIATVDAWYVFPSAISAVTIMDPTELYYGDSDAATTTSITIPGASGDFTGKTITILSGAANCQVRSISNWDNTSKVATVPNWVTYAGIDAVPDAVSTLTIHDPATLKYTAFNHNGQKYIAGNEVIEALNRHFIDNPEDFLTTEVLANYAAAIDMGTEGDGEDFTYFMAMDKNDNYTANLNDPETPDFEDHICKLVKVRFFAPKNTCTEPQQMITPLSQDVWAETCLYEEKSRGLYAVSGFPGVTPDARRVTWTGVLSNRALNGGSFTITLNVGAGDVTTASIAYNTNRATMASAIEAVLPANHYAQVVFTFAGSNWSGFYLKIYNDDPTNWKFERTVYTSVFTISTSLTTSAGSVTATIPSINNFDSYLQWLDHRLDDPTVIIQGTSATLANIVTGTAQALVATHTGIAQSGADSTIILATGASASSDTYVKHRVTITSGKGVGQFRTIKTYTGSSRTATVSAPWDRTIVDSLRAFDSPDNTSTYSIFPAHQIKLASDDAAANDAYIGYRITITGGTGSGQYRHIVDYDSSTKIATVDIPWTTLPDATSTYAIKHASQINLTGVAGISSDDDEYNGKTIVISDGTGHDQVRYISDYNGTTKIATLNVRWHTIPDNTSVFTIKEGMGALVKTIGVGSNEVGIPIEIPFWTHRDEWNKMSVDLYFWECQQWALANGMPSDELFATRFNGTDEQEESYKFESATLEEYLNEQFLQLREDPRWQLNVNGVRTRYGRYLTEEIATGTHSLSADELQSMTGTQHDREGESRGRALYDAPVYNFGEGWLTSNNYDEASSSHGYQYSYMANKTWGRLGLGSMCGNCSANNTYSRYIDYNEDFFNYLNDGVTATSRIALPSTGYTTHPLSFTRVKKLDRVSGTVTVQIFGEDYVLGSVIHSGTVRSSTVNTITLAADDSAVDDAYTSFGNVNNNSTVNRTILITEGKGTGQVRTITDYNGTTKVATVNNNWTTFPDTTSVYRTVVPGNTVYSGVIQSASNGASRAVIVLDNGASAVDAAYDGTMTFIIKTGVGAGQAVRVYSSAGGYISASRTLTLQQNLSVVPTAGDEFTICKTTGASRQSGSLACFDGIIPNKTWLHVENGSSYTGATAFLHPFYIFPLEGAVASATSSTVVLSYANVNKLDVATNPSVLNGAYVGMKIVLKSGLATSGVAGTGAGQYRTITGYSVTNTGSGNPALYTYTCTVDQPWEITPDTTTVYRVYSDNPNFLVTDVGVGDGVSVPFGVPYLTYNENLSPVRDDASVTNIFTNTNSVPFIRIGKVFTYQQLEYAIYAARVVQNSSKFPFAIYFAGSDFPRFEQTDWVDNTLIYESWLHSWMNGMKNGVMFIARGNRGSDPVDEKNLYKLAKEITSLVGKESFTPLPIDYDFIRLDSRNRYLITGLVGEGKRIYRISLQQEDNVTEDIPTVIPGILDQSPATFLLVDGDTLTIPNSQIVTYPNSVTEDGFWVIETEEPDEETPVLVPPVLNVINDFTGTVGTRVTFFVVGHDSDSDDALTYTLVGAPIGATINSSTGLFDWTPTELQTGIQQFIVRIIDSDFLFDEQVVSAFILSEDDENPISVGNRDLEGISGFTCKDFALPELRIKTTWKLVNAGSTKDKATSNNSDAYVSAITVCGRLDFFVAKCSTYLCRGDA